AEDGIRDRTVTGVQTCALPIFTLQTETCDQPVQGRGEHVLVGRLGVRTAGARERDSVAADDGDTTSAGHTRLPHWYWLSAGGSRSEERRVGKEGRWGWGAGACR